MNLILMNYTSCTLITLIYRKLDYTLSSQEVQIERGQTHFLQSLFLPYFFCLPTPNFYLLIFVIPSIEFIFNGNKLSLINDGRITTLHCFMIFGFNNVLFFILQLTNERRLFLERIILKKSLLWFYAGISIDFLHHILSC